jgi:hypothetical protein
MVITATAKMSIRSFIGFLLMAFLLRLWRKLTNHHLLKSSPILAPKFCKKLVASTLEDGAITVR